ncbi:hypothetical protein Tco_0935179 [Tanacetum coccineum]
MWIRNPGQQENLGDLQLGIESYQTKLNLERPNWDATDYYFKEDYTIVPKPRAIIYRDRNNQRKLMSLKELHKFSDGTLTRVMEKLDHMVKDFHLFEYNKSIRLGNWIRNFQVKQRFHNEDGNPPIAYNKQASWVAVYSLHNILKGDGNGKLPVTEMSRSASLELKVEFKNLSTASAVLMDLLSSLSLSFSRVK